MCDDDESPEKLYPKIDSDLIEMFTNLCPYGEYGIHTIESIVVYERINEEKII